MYMMETGKLFFETNVSVLWSNKKFTQIGGLYLNGIVNH